MIELAFVLLHQRRKLDSRPRPSQRRGRTDAGQSATHVLIKVAHQFGIPACTLHRHRDGNSDVDLPFNAKKTYKRVPSVGAEDVLDFISYCSEIMFAWFSPMRDISL